MDMTPHLYDRVELVVALPDEPYAGSHPLATWRGLEPGDRGAVVEFSTRHPDISSSSFMWSVSASDELGMTFVLRDDGRKLMASCSQHYQC